LILTLPAPISVSDEWLLILRLPLWNQGLLLGLKSSVTTP
jgi:hypothetical protein